MRQYLVCICLLNTALKVLVAPKQTFAFAKTCARRSNGSSTSALAMVCTFVCATCFYHFCPVVTRNKPQTLSCANIQWLQFASKCSVPIQMATLLKAIACLAWYLMCRDIQCGAFIGQWRKCSFLPASWCLEPMNYLCICFEPGIELL